MPHSTYFKKFSKYFGNFINIYKRLWISCCHKINRCMESNWRWFYPYIELMVWFQSGSLLWHIQSFVNNNYKKRHLFFVKTLFRIISEWFCVQNMKIISNSRRYFSVWIKHLCSLHSSLTVCKDLEEIASNCKDHLQRSFAKIVEGQSYQMAFPSDFLH